LSKTMEGKKRKALALLYPVEEPSKLTARDMFEYLYYMVGLGAADSFELLCDEMGWSMSRSLPPPEDGQQGAGELQDSEEYVLTEYDIRSAFIEHVASAEESVQFEVAAQRVYEELYGFGAADILIMDRSLDGVSGGCGGSTGPEGAAEASRSFDTIYVMYHGRTVRMKFLSFGSEKALEQTVRKLTRNDARSTLCRKNPYLVCSLADNSRVVATRPPYSPSWTFYVRRFSSSRTRDIESLITDNGNHRAIGILKMLTMSEQNFVISGNQGGGKTTLLKCLVQYIDPRYTLRVAENNFELNLNNIYPERNVHTLQERESFSVYSSITAFKKMDSDVVILGEINEPKLAGAFVQLVQNGGRMAVSTLHHNSTEKLIAYMRNALVSEFGISDVETAERQVVDSINFDVHMVRDKEGHHYIERITEIVPSGRDAEGMRTNYECHDILLFDKINRCYVVTDMISEYARERIRATCGGRKVIEFCAFLRREAGRAA
ncbi:MAG: Flp pilus assembly complex ATPase component TadA, partial [Lachnospiraceae bacterium]|nr:Flp pilus assembly complex ATPase component TadA [Lachnospiraceae bacterium]